MDITNESQVQNLYAEIQKVFGRSADVLVNNAGSGAEPHLVGQLPVDQFKNVVDSHFLGSFLTSKYFISTQANPEQPAGTIVYVTSAMSAMIVPGYSSYSVAKYAGNRFVEYLDAEYPNLRTFSLSPGIIVTGMTDESFKPFAKDHVDLPGLFSVYLSQERADFLRGGFVGINWDITELEAHQKEIKEQRLLKFQFVPAQFGKNGHPWAGNE